MSEEKRVEDDNWRDLLKQARKKGEEGSKKIFGGGNGRFRFSMWYLLAAIVLMALLNMMFMQGDYNTVPYSEFLTLIDDGAIKEVNYSGSSLVGYSRVMNTTESAGTLADYFNSLSGTGETILSWRTERVPDDPNLLDIMESNGVVYEVIPERTNYLLIFLRSILPFIILIVIWRYMMKRMGGFGGGSGVMSFGQNKAKIVAEKGLQTRFKDVAGCEEAKDELIEIVDFLKAPKKYTDIGGKIPKGALLVGPPGTGKTLLARAVAGEAGVTFFHISGADFMEMFVGVGAARVRDLFKQAREKAPCIVFVDELDAIGKKRSGALSSNEEREQTINQLLVEMDGFDSTSGVVVLAATNWPEVLDPALLRPGRFDRQIVVDKPDQEGREAILRIHSENVKLDNSVSLADVAKATAGLAGADLANIVNEAALLAVRRGKKLVDKHDFMEAIEKSAIGLEKKNKILHPHEREVTAYHETGHALMNVFTPDQHMVKKITIVPRGYGIMGYMLPVAEEERSFQTREELFGQIDVLLGGRAAEEIVYGTVSTGAGNDIMRATEIARAMITRLGMSERFANVSLDKRSTGFLGEQPVYGQGREYSEDTQRYIDEEIARVMSERYEGVLVLLKKHKGLLEKITSKLMDDETIEREELMEMIESDTKGKKEFTARKKADLKPSERAKESGEARNDAIKERIAERRAAEKEAARKADAERKAREEAEKAAEEQEG